MIGSIMRSEPLVEPGLTTTNRVGEAAEFVHGGEVRSHDVPMIVEQVACPETFTDRRPGH